MRPYLAISLGDLALVKPLTYMNRSGNILSHASRRFRAGSGEVLVICDNMDLPVGAIRFKRNGRSRNHNGIGSVMDALGTGEFARLYVGVGRPSSSDEVVDHVLSRPTGDELVIYDRSISQAADVVQRLADERLDAVISSFSRDQASG